jgi:hypothetical protein
MAIKRRKAPNKRLTVLLLSAVQGYTGARMTVIVRTTVPKKNSFRNRDENFPTRFLEDFKRQTSALRKHLST